MSIADKAKNKAQDALGKAKEKVGDVTGNDELKRDGRADQTKAATKQAGEKVKDAATDVKDAFTRD